VPEFVTETETLKVSVCEVERLEGVMLKSELEKVLGHMRSRWKKTARRTK
jgi:hypothetical protein